MQTPRSDIFYNGRYNGHVLRDGGEVCEDIYRFFGEKVDVELNILVGSARLENCFCFDWLDLFELFAGVVVNILIGGYVFFKGLKILWIQ